MVLLLMLIGSSLPVIWLLLVVAVMLWSGSAENGREIVAFGNIGVITINVFSGGWNYVAIYVTVGGILIIIGDGVIGVVESTRFFGVMDYAVFDVVAGLQSAFGNEIFVALMSCWNYLRVTAVHWVR